MIAFDWFDDLMSHQLQERRPGNIAMGWLKSMKIEERHPGSIDIKWLVDSNSNHNIKIIHSRKDSLSRPYVVPYDFDFSGLVNTTYSSPDERLGIEKIVFENVSGVPVPLISGLEVRSFSRY